MKIVLTIFFTLLFNWNISSQNTSIDLDGTDDYIDMVSIPAGFEYTFEMWFKLDAVSFNTRILSGSSSHEDIYSVAVLNNDLLYISIGGGGTPAQAATTTIQPNTWYHIAYVRTSSTEVDFYMNGVQEMPTILVDDAVEWVDEMRIGSPFVLNGNPNGLYMDGQVDEVRLWNGVKTAYQIEQHYLREMSGLEFGLNTYYKFDDMASPDDIVDCHYTGNHGVRVGPGGSNNLPQYVSDQPSGLYDVDCLELVIECNEERKIEFEIVDNDDESGGSVGMSGDRIIVGSENNFASFDLQGSVFLYELNGSTWDETVLCSDFSSYNSDFGNAVDIDGDRVIVGASRDETGGLKQGSAYIFEWDGVSWNETRLIANDGEEFDFFGRSVSISGDRAIVSAPFDNDQGTGSGSLYVFDLQGGVWNQTAKLDQGIVQIQSYFGYSCDLEDDRIVVGVPYFNESGALAQGQVVIFEFDGAVWNGTQILASDGDAFDNFGFDVSLSNDRIVVGSPSDDDVVGNSGSIYVFTYDGSGWNELKIIEDTPTIENRFGESVSISGDRIIASSKRYMSSTGKSTILDWNGSNWIQVDVVASDGLINDNFGSDVVVDGDRVCVGAEKSSVNGADESGSGYVYELTGGNWVEEKIIMEGTSAESSSGLKTTDLYANQMVIADRFYNNNTGRVILYDWDGIEWIGIDTLTASDAAAADQFGRDVSIFQDRIIVGASGNDDIAESSGSVYIYDWDGTMWIESKINAFDPAAFDRFGSSVSLFENRAIVGAVGNNGSIYVLDWDGTMWNQTKIIASSPGGSFGNVSRLDHNRFIVGAPGNNDAGFNSGAAYIFDWDGSTWVETKILASDAEAGDLFGQAVDLDLNKVIVGANGEDSNGASSGAAYIYEFDGSNWLETKLIASNGQPSDSYGTRVAINSNRVLIGSNLADNSGVDQGSVYLYELDNSVWNETIFEASDADFGAKFGSSLSIFNNRFLIGNSSRFFRIYDYQCGPTIPVFCDEVTAEIDTTIVPLDTLSDYIYAVQDWVKLTGSILSGIGEDTFVDVRASQFIELKPSFTVELGTRVSFEIAPCDNTIINLAQPEEDIEVSKQNNDGKEENPDIKFKENNSMKKSK